MHQWLSGVVASCLLLLSGADARAADPTTAPARSDGASQPAATGTDTLPASASSDAAAPPDTAPLPSLPSSAPAYYDAPPLPPPLGPRPRRIRWGAVFRVEAAPMGSDS